MLDSDPSQTELSLPEGVQEICAHITGVMWKLLIQEGGSVKQGEVVAIIESMKMEFSIESPVNGTVVRIFAGQGNTVSTGQALVWVSKE